MFKALSKLFGANKSEQETSTFDQMMANRLKREREGANIAEDCLINGLRKGELVKLSEIESAINSNFTYDPGARVSGFISKMIEYSKTGEVIVLKVENDETVFIHKVYIKSFIK